MEVRKIACLVFSPTGGCLKIARSISRCLANYELEFFDITKPETRVTMREMPSEVDYAIIVYPVYGDTMPGLVKDYLSGLAMGGIPVTLVAGYANINKGKALSHVREIIESKGCVVCSACTVVIPHSYNGDRLNIAPDEPSKTHLDSINEFIGKTIEKILNSPDLRGCRASIPEGKMRLMTRMPQKILTRFFIKKPIALPERCNDCRACVIVCPSGAIDERLEIDDEKCFRCLACVKFCHQRARLFKTRTGLLIWELSKHEIGFKGNNFYIN